MNKAYTQQAGEIKTDMGQPEWRSPERIEQAKIVLWVGTVATLVVLGLRLLGALGWLELLAYDWLMRQRPAAPKESRILVVGITEQDLQQLGGVLQLPDRTYANLLSTLLRSQPRAIGLDIYRDTPLEPGHQALNRVLKQSDRIIGITKVGDETQSPIAPPAALPLDQIGFNDVLVDPDGIIRRNLLYQPGDLHPATAQAKEAPILPSFSLQLALRYLRDADIEPEANRYNPDHLQLRNTVFLPLLQNDGGYVKADTRGYQVLLNYRGGPQTIPFVSLGAVLRGEVPEAQIRDRIILIGNVAESAKDFFYTPYSAGQAEGRMPGVMVHAQMVSQFLDAALDQRRLLWVWPEGIEVLWILGWALLGAGLAVRSPRLLVLLVTAPASVMVLGGLCFWAMVQGGWIPLVPSLLSFVSATVGAVAYRAQQSQRQQQMVMRLLGQSTSPEIAATLWQQRDALLRNGQLPGQRLTATIVFTDLKGFSTISERYPPEQLLLWLNEYLDEMARQVQQYQGVINKFTGDGIMAVFGVPIAHERPDEIRRDAQNAVDCAIAMGERLDRLNQSWQAQGLPAVQMRVGIFTGPVVVGSLGSPIRLEYGVIGDGVNIASRLESVDKHRQPSACRILIAQQTQACLPSHYQVESWGMLSLAGKQVQVEVFLVTGCNKSSSPPDQNSVVERL